MVMACWTVLVLSILVSIASMAAALSLNALADCGQTGYDANGTVYTCAGDREHPHWE
jgi:hypothetical protein